MRSGSLTYLGRAFSQDAWAAMGGDVVRGLIELITNCDDAYGKANGDIEILVDRPDDSDSAVLLTVRDKAKGLTPDQMIEAFTMLGAETSGFSEGEEVRGLFGRGSKDTCVFGKTVFESIKDGTYSNLEINPDQTWQLDDRSATPDDYSRLGYKQGTSGLMATMHVFPSICRVPPNGKLYERLSSHVQLRQINQTKNVTFAQLKNGQLINRAPVVWELPVNEEIVNTSIDISEYDVKANVVVRKLAQRVDDSVDDYSIPGIVIRGNRASYMNTMFGLSGHGVGFITGEIFCPKIDELIRDFDVSDKQSAINENNPVRLVRRDRIGLETNHPFMRALSMAVLEILKPIIDSLEPKQTETGSSELKKDLNRLAKMLGELMREDLDESEDDHNVGGNLPTPQNPIIVIPPISRGKLGGKRTLTVLIHADSVAAKGLSVDVSSAICSLVSEPTVPVPHSNFENTMVSQVRMSLDDLGSCRVVVSATADRSINSAADILVHDDERPDDVPPTTLEWKNTSMSVTVGKERTLTLRAPIDLAPSGELSVKVSLDGDTVELIDTTTMLRLITKGWLTAKVRVKGLKTGDAQKIIVSDGTLEALGTVKTSLPSPMAGLNFELKIEPVENGPYRGQVKETDTGRVMHIWAKHPALAKYLGKLNADDSYQGESRPEARGALAETIASVAADFVLQHEVRSDPSMYQDADKVLQKRTTLVHRYLKMLVEAVNGEN